MLVRHRLNGSCAQAPQRRASATQRRPLSVVCSIRARWCIDVRYGCKQDATALLQEWVKDIGSRAGLSNGNTRLSSGAIGVPESRLELEVSFNSMAEWEQFLGSIPSKEHKAWSQRIQAMVTNDNSPKWEVFRVVPVDADLSPAQATTSAASNSSATLQLPGISFQPPPLRREVTPSSYAPSVLDSPATVGAGSSSPFATPELTVIDDSAAAEVILDWKGEPMKLNPGDKLPFKFL